MRLLRRITQCGLRGPLDRSLLSRAWIDGAKMQPFTLGRLSCSTEKVLYDRAASILPAACANPWCAKSSPSPHSGVPLAPPRRSAADSSFAACVVRHGRCLRNHAKPVGTGDFNAPTARRTQLAPASGGVGILGRIVFQNAPSHRRAFASTVLASDGMPGSRILGNQRRVGRTDRLLSHRRDPHHRYVEAATGYRCEHAVVLSEGDGQRIVLAEHQAADPEAALRWVIERSSCISAHLSAPAAEAVEVFVADDDHHTSFLAALKAGHGYGFEVSDPGTCGSLDRPTVHRFTTRQPRTPRQSQPE